MNRQKSSFVFPPGEMENIKRRMLHWANQCDILLFLDSNEYTHTEGTYECLCAAGAHHIIDDADGRLGTLKEYYSKHKDWLFGHIQYDYKNKLEHLVSDKPVRFRFPEVHFFTPLTICSIARGENVLRIETMNASPEEIWEAINNQELPERSAQEVPLQFEKRIQKAEYLQLIQQLRKHILEGDCYEINFCNEAFCHHANIHPVSSFDRLNQLSRAPFAAFYKLDGQYLLCASPERYLRKAGDRIIAQPIKGTTRRSGDPVSDGLQKIYLQESIKERAENVMIVDLMRNDLARFCKLGTVKVEELFGIYSFPQVHQMISTISGILHPDQSLFDAIRYSFPIGSMTGAPKIMVMKLIEQYEKARRELFSGCVGYIDPEGNFDFNVVIRSLFYNSYSAYLSYQSGGAITYDSDPEQEWEETLVKAMALEAVFA